DLERIKLFYGDNLAFRKKMFQELLRFIPQYFADLQVAIAAQNFDQVVYHAHRLRGSLTSASVHRVPEWCEAIETAATQEDFVEIQSLEALIRVGLEETIAFLEHYVETH
ncbi:MAG: Hpt domain-containing protein, partial [Limnothrix sp.]